MRCILIYEKHLYTKLHITIFTFSLFEFLSETGGLDTFKSAFLFKSLIYTEGVSKKGNLLQFRCF